MMWVMDSLAPASAQSDGERWHHSRDYIRRLDRECATLIVFGRLSINPWAYANTPAHSRMA